MLRKILAIVLAMSLVNPLSAQDSTTKRSLTISGSADAYFKYNLGESKANNLTSFTNSHNSFELGMASLRFDYQATKVEMVADLGFGKRAQEFSSNDEGVPAAVKQLYISYSANEWLKLTAGSWATHVGYELLDPQLNKNYSMSYMFTNGPFFHTGIKADITRGASSFMIGVANPTDFKYVPDDQVNSKFVIAQYSFAPGDHFKVAVNYVSGKGLDTTKSHQFDLVLTSKFSDLFSLGYNGTVNRTKTYMGGKKYDAAKSWWGSAVYLNIDPSEKLGLTLREEYFSDYNQLKMYRAQLRGGSIFASTLSANFKTDNFIFIPEVRLDNASEKIFINRDGNTKKTAVNILLAAIYYF